MGLENELTKEELDLIFLTMAGFKTGCEMTLAKSPGGLNEVAVRANLKSAESILDKIRQYTSFA